MNHLKKGRPNVVFIFADQLRRQATGFGGETCIKTPNLDRLAAESLNFQHAISGTPVCCPARASLLTGRFSQNHGVIVNDVHLDEKLPSLGKVVAAAGYETAYIGKWHLNGRGRKEPVPEGQRGGFKYWRAMECTHDYNRSEYYCGGEKKPRVWPGYDASAQTDEALKYIKAARGSRQPFFLMLSWGPPHDPYNTAPLRFRRMIDPKALTLRPNVPRSRRMVARKEIAGYYAHILALDESLGRLLAAIDAGEPADDTIVVFWSDHGDMLHSQAEVRKQRPWDESIRVPLLIRYPHLFGRQERLVQAPINTPDLMPTLLGLMQLKIPANVDGKDYTPHLLGRAPPPHDGALLSCLAPCGEYSRKRGGREYRGFRTERYTYVEDLKGPWLLYDNILDPYQLKNLAGRKEFDSLGRELAHKMRVAMQQSGDEFLTGPEYTHRFGIEVDEEETVPVRDWIS